MYGTLEVHAATCRSVSLLLQQQYRIMEAHGVKLALPASMGAKRKRVDYRTERPIEDAARISSAHSFQRRLQRR